MIILRQEPREDSKRGMAKLLVASSIGVCLAACSPSQTEFLPPAEQASVDTEQFTPEEFLAFSEAKVKDKDFDCPEIPKLDEAACKIFQSAYGIYPHVESSRFKAYYAIEAANHVQNVLSSSRYSLVKRSLKDEFKRPGTDVELCLDYEYGICGNHAAVFIALLERIGLETRPVQFFYNTKNGRESHISAEVNIDGWRYLDSTWAAFWYTDPADPTGSIASIADVLKRRKEYKVSVNTSHPWYIKQKLRADPLAYVTLNPSVVYDYNDGVVSMEVPSDVDGELDLSHIPNFVGDHLPDGQFRGVSYKLAPPRGESRLTFDIRGVGGCTTENSRLCVDDECEILNPENLKSNPVLSIEASSVEAISVVSDDDVCYLVPRSISIETAGSMEDGMG